MTRCRVAGMLLAMCVTASCATQQVARPTPSTSPASSPQAADSPVPASLWLGTIQRLDSRTGLVAAWNGTGPALARTSDGGLTWQAIPVPDMRITSLRFIDSKIGWIAGFSADKQLVLRTQDGGATWQQALVVPNAPGADPLLQIQAVDGQLAWVLVQPCVSAGQYTCPSELRRTSDGGRSWTTLARGNIVAVRFADATRGWIAEHNSYMGADIKVTSDGGSTWTLRTHTSSGDVVGLDAASGLAAWVLTRDGGYCTASTCSQYQVVRTIDGGITWRSLGNPKAAGGNCWGGQLAGPVFATPTRGWLAENTGAGGAAASTGLLRSEDGGVTWHCENAPTQTTLISAADPLHVWAARQHAGTEASLYSSEDGGLTWHAVNLGALIQAK